MLVTLFLLVTTIVYSTDSSRGTICTDSGVSGDVGVVRSTGDAGGSVQLVLVIG